MTLTACPPWCDLEPGHDPPDLERMAKVAAMGKVPLHWRHHVHEVGPVAVELWRIDRTDETELARTEIVIGNGEPLTADQARQLSALLAQAAEELAAFEQVPG